MTPAELARPWRTLDLLEAWTPCSVYLRHGRIEQPFRPWVERVRIVERDSPVKHRNEERHELLDLVAAIELDRVQRTDIDRLWGWKLSRPDYALPWAELMDGASGLVRESAPGWMTVAQALERVGLAFVRAEYGPREGEGVKQFDGPASGGGDPRRAAAPQDAARGRGRAAASPARGARRPREEAARDAASSSAKGRGAAPDQGRKRVSGGKR
jgi:hypothetical protein